MDFFSALTLFIILFIVFSLCGFCCRSKRKGTIFSSVNFPWGLVVFVIIVILFSVCTHCCKEPKRAVYATPVVVTSATHTAPGGYPQGMQTVSVYPTSTPYQQNMYPAQAPYPVSGGLSGMPMPMAHTQMQSYPMGGPSGMPMPMTYSQMQPNPIGMPQPSGVTPYPPTGANPPYPTAGPSMNPPSYESAVGPTTNVHPNPNQTGYEKQSPYNPTYATNY